MKYKFLSIIVFFSQLVYGQCDYEIVTSDHDAFYIGRWVNRTDPIMKNFGHLQMPTV